jgi:hypothetical protein
MPRQSVSQLANEPAAPHSACPHCGYLEVWIHTSNAGTVTLGQLRSTAATGHWPLRVCSRGSAEDGAYSRVSQCSTKAGAQQVSLHADWQPDKLTDRQAAWLRAGECRNTAAHQAAHPPGWNPRRSAGQRTRYGDPMPAGFGWLHRVISAAGCSTWYCGFRLPTLQWPSCRCFTGCGSTMVLVVLGS